MKTLIGIALITVGVVLGLFVGLYVELYGGLVQAINAFDGPGVDSSALAIGAIRVLTFELAGFLAGIIPVLVGGAVLTYDGE